MRFVSPDPITGCWTWIGGFGSEGYGRVSIGRYRTGAHRHSYILFVDAIPKGLMVLHSCDVRSCVNPDHLFLGTHKDNASDMARKGRGLKSRRGLPYGVLFFNRPNLKNKFQARVRVNYKTHCLGYYATADEASAVSVAFRNKTYGITDGNAAVVS